jgi:lipopolysaccharide export system protein LptA
MRWQRAARLVLVVVGLGCAVAIYLLTRERPPLDPPPAPPPPADLDAKQFGGPGKLILMRGAERSGVITYTRSAEFPDGRMRLENGVYKDERGFTITAERLIARGPAAQGAPPTEVEMEGAVTFTDASGLEVRTVNGTYDDRQGVLTLPGEVTFSRGRISGRGVGAIYRRETDSIQLLKDANARVAPDQAGAGGAEATATTMTLERGQKALLLDGQARIVSDRETLSGDVGNLFFTEDESALRFLELRGHASVVPIDPAAGGAPDMRGDNITITFHPDGRTVQHATVTGSASLQLADAGGRRSIRGSWIDLFTAADGRTLTRLEAKDNVVVVLPATADAPAREIRAATLLATGAEAKGLETARFQSGVRFVEKGTAGKPGDRTVTSQALVLGLAGALDAIERAEFQREGVFVDGALRGEADLIVYDAAKERVVLTPGTRTPPRDPRVRDEQVTIDAASIDLALQTHDMHARGRVRTVSSRKGEPRPGALFDGDDPVLGAAAELDYRKDTGRAAYTGTSAAPAVVRQGVNVIEGGTVTLAEQTGNVEAAGGVSTTFVMAARDEASKPVEYRTTAGTFHYDDAKRVAIYRSDASAPPVEMTGSDKSQTTGRTITLQLAADARTLETLTVERDVWAKLPDGTEVKGDALTVNEATGIYLLTGKSARVKSAPDGKSEKCTLTVGEVIEFNRRTREVTQPRGGSQAFNAAQPIACASSIR